MEYIRRLEFVLHAAKVAQADVDTCVRRFESELNNIGSVYYTQTPSRRIAEALIAAKVNGGLIGEMRVGLRGKLWEAIDDCLKQTDPARMNLDAQAISSLQASLQRAFADYSVNL